MDKYPERLAFRQARQMLMLKQKEMAFETGLSQTDISNTETGKDIPNYKKRTLQRFCEERGIGFSPDGKFAVPIMVPVHCQNAKRNKRRKAASSLTQLSRRIMDCPNRSQAAGNTSAAILKCLGAEPPQNSVPPITLRFAPGKKMPRNDGS